MKPFPFGVGLIALAIVFTPVVASPVIFTADTLIAPLDSSYDGQDIIVSNAMLTVDGPHSFASLRLAGGAVLTHSANSNGVLEIVVQATDEMQFLVGTNASTLLNSNVSLPSVVVKEQAGPLIYTNGADYSLGTIGFSTTLQRTETSAIPDGATVLVSYQYRQPTNAGLQLAIAGNLEVESGASINANGRGYSHGRGSGLGSSAGFPLSGGGGGHGGYGGVSSTNAAGGVPFGSPFDPGNAGGAGGSGLGGFGNAGGGLVNLNVGGHFVLNGTVTVNGLNATNSRSGGGAGGSIRLTVQTISGTGAMTANGGAGEPIHGGGGGGGRVALEFETNVFAGSLVAIGGTGWQRGGAGTVFIRTNGATGRVVVDNGGAGGGATLMQLTNVADLALQGRAVALLPSAQTVRNLLVRSNCSITTTATNNATLNLTATGDAIVENGATLTVAGKGFPANQGTGLGQTSQAVGSGAGHGGYGGSGLTGAAVASGGNYYGSLTEPATFGSGGRTIGSQLGGAGGGAVRLTVAGNLQLNGQINANGTAGVGSVGGGASGGSVWLALGGISGAGIVSANGGAGGLPNGGGGAGGRIALTYNSNLFNGALTAAGGTGAVVGGAGTIYARRNSQTMADLTVGNGGLTGTNTVLEVNGNYNLTISGGAALRVTAFASLSLGTLEVGSNSAFMVGPLTTGSTSVSLNIASNATVAAGGSISGDGFGSPGGTGTGAGLASQAGSTGGGHGGYGGRGAGFTNSSSPGGNIYDSTASPILPGSGGGGLAGAGGAGGGALRMTVSGQLILEGRISANGLNTVSNWSGGGAGGSLYLTLNQFSGSGLISANGGTGHLPNGGGGGGGRIAITWNSNSFTGTYSAKGGNGFVAGGAGTIYLKANQRPNPDLIIDNGGLVGTNTVLDLSSLLNLTIGSGASVTSSLSRVTITSNLTIAASATWRAGSLNLTAGAANIAAGGGLVADGVSISGQGSGQYASLGSAGGGHGGYGGRGAGTTSGGNYYDSTSNPSQAGSPGGAPSPGGPGGAPGGGALQMTISGPLILNGRITANAAGSSTNGGGGGSGGSIWLTLNQLSGSGSILANGGSGHLPNGGGGGGGRIAIYYNSNSFAGDISARGGNGFVIGGAGTIYLKASNRPAPDLILDNGGLVGTNTALDLSQMLNLTVGAGANVSLGLSSYTIISNLHIGSQGVLRLGTGYGYTLSVGGSATIAVGGSLAADGSASSYTDVSFSNAGSGGGGHGGSGGAGAGSLGGSAFGSIAQPGQSGRMGGGGITLGGGAGGGALRMTVSGVCTVNGSMSANGLNARSNLCGGGAGGSIWLTLNQLSGSGSIQANGGSGHLPNGGGGGGGRIALYFNTNAFAGSLSARGGNGYVAGGAGTIYLKANTSPTPNVITDNGGLIGTNTPLDLGTISNLTVTGGAIVRPTIPTLSLNNLTIQSNSALLASSSSSSAGAALTLNITGAAIVAAGGRISAEGLGFTSGNGASGGAGQLGVPGSGGGGHGGYGGRGQGGLPTASPGAGGNAYDSLISPISSGSGGGGQNLSGGSGGGALRMSVLGPLTLDGIITANGANTSTNGAGGGAGGSVWLTLNELIGSGSIAADGGSGHLPNGGGGGGGRVSVSYSFLRNNYPTNGFTGTMSARGGAGYVKGGAGTVYVRTNFSSIANVFVDNGGTRGTNTLVSGTGSLDLYVQGGAMATSLGVPRDLFVRSNSWVVQTGNWSVLRNATFDSGGGISLDGLGTTTVGRGSTFATPKGGGGHGGYGALNPPGAGNAYDLAASPALSGSAGGNGSGSESLAPFGGAGGGAMHLTVGSTLTVNGEFSANGNDGDFNSGGGAGGSVWIQTSTLTGNGLITATGGSGNGSAGGGGGGRIAVYYSTNMFTGSLSTCGGAGGVFGGAGTIYLRDNGLAISSLVLDNCGNWGANTPLSLNIGLATNLTVTGRAVAEMQGIIPVLSNVVVSAGGEITSGSNDTNLYLALLGNLSVTENSGIITDAKGFARDDGPGYGETYNNQGGGGSYGGWGGDSASGAYGGMIYGSATKPVDRGSGGGSGSGYPAAGSEGGGAIRLAVAGTIELNGVISAGGGFGWQDDSGGGSGGSVWLSARKFTGDGTLAAIGGDGDFFGGGGGGGGRIAIYSPMNTFTGLVSVIGGDGANFGEAGTIFTSGSLSGFDVVTQTPTGVVSNVVSQVALEFSEPVNLASVSGSDIRIYAPYGPLPDANKTFALLSPATLLVSFNPQNIPGNYRVEVGPLIEGLLAPRMSQVYTGAFSIALSTVSGTVTNLNGQPVAGVTLLPDGGLLGVTTDAGGNYSLGVPPGWAGSVTPALGTNTFVPGRLNYTNLTASVTAQNYLVVNSIAPTLDSSLSGAGLTLRWSGIAGVMYQPEYSTNLLNWLPYGPALPGTNGWMQLLVPTADPMEFVRLRATN